MTNSLGQKTGLVEAAVQAGLRSLQTTQEQVEIARNVEKIAQMSEENTAAVRSNSEEVLRLEGFARALQSAVSRFRV